MKKFIETIKNIWKIEDLRARIVYTLGIILIYRLGTHIVLPGIDPVIISQLASSRQSSGGILDLLNLFTGGAFARASIFGLGIMPYISASIVVQLLGIAVPYFQKRKEKDQPDHQVPDRGYSDPPGTELHHQPALPASR